MSTGDLRVRLASDLHSEFYNKSEWPKITEEVVGDKTAYDVLCLCGDEGDSRTAGEFVTQICQAVAPKPVLWVLGNHNYYHTTLAEGLKEARGAESANSNLTLLENEVKEIYGQRFLGTTLWYDQHKHRHWPDFRHIYDLDIAILSMAREAYQFLKDNLQSGDVVLTHMLPSYRCVDPIWKYSEENVYFVHPLDTLIEERKPKLMCHGHTHNFRDIRIGDTRLVCCPRGYPHETETGWQKDFIITLPR